MRSDQIHKALKQGVNRFEVCQLVAKGLKATHRTGSRFEDTINDVLQYIGTHDTTQESVHPAKAKAMDKAIADKALKPAA